MAGTFNFKGIERLRGDMETHSKRKRHFSILFNFVISLKLDCIEKKN